MIYILIILSFLLESVITNIVNINSFLTPLFLLTSFSILYPYFKNNNINFIIACIICGLFYDISFTNSAFINTISFGLCGGIIIFSYKYSKYNIYTSNIINIFSILFYRIISYLLLCIIDYIRFNFNYLFAGIYNSILINIIYGIIIYIVIDLISKKFNINKGVW